MKNIDIVGAKYCTKYDEFIDILSEESSISCLGNCEKCNHAHTVTKMVNKIIIKNGEIIELD